MRRYYKDEGGNSLDDSALFKTCNEELFLSSVEVKPAGMPLIILKEAPKAEYIENVMFSMGEKSDSILLSFKPSKLRVKVKEQIYVSFATIDLVVLTTILRATAPKNPQVPQ